MRHENNLLLTSLDFIERSRRFAQKEDYFTEVLAALLRSSADLCGRFLGLPFVDSDQRVPDEDSWLVETQESITVRDEEQGTEETAIPDLVLRSSGWDEDGKGHLLAVEVKVDQWLKESQLKTYHRWLEQQSDAYRSVHLAALTPSRPGRLFSGLRSCCYWRRVLSWEEVEEIVRSSLNTDESFEKGTYEVQVARQAFRTYAEDFQELLAEEGLVAPTQIEPAEVATQMQQQSGRDDGIRSAIRLLRIALERAGVFHELGRDARDWPRKRTASGIRGVQSMNGFYRIIFQVPGHAGTFLFFGYAYRQQGWMLREGEEENDLDDLELLAGLEVWENAGDSASNRLSAWLEGDGPPDGPNWQIADRLNEVLSSPIRIFVPLKRERRQWAKFVGRQSTAAFPSQKGAQLEAMAEFYMGFLEAFLGVSGTVIQRQEATLLDAISEWLLDEEVAE